MSKFGNCGNPQKLAEFMRAVQGAKLLHTRLRIWVELSPIEHTHYDVKVEDLANLVYTDMDIYLKGEYLCSWWDLCRADILIEL